mmetsp:Transcript_10759/g.30219  ORF Transcript_10759/g.30219 Transcript_10759/m.30219 type:complete len:313 (+) Transcript_10759:700-1638(+)
MASELEAELGAALMGAEAFLPREAISRLKGSAHSFLKVELVRGASVATELLSTYPLRLHCMRRPEATWCFVLTLGGGLCSGDNSAVVVAVREGASCAVRSVGALLVFKANILSHTGLLGRVARGALLAIAPQHTVCFADARMEQNQVVELAPGGSLCLVDWLGPGREARGESWAFQSYASSLLVTIGGSPLLLERQDLSTAGMGGFTVPAVVVLVGPALMGCFAKAEEMVQTWCPVPGPPRHRGERSAEVTCPTPPFEDPVLMSAIPLCVAGQKVGVLVRIAGRSVEHVRVLLRDLIEPLSPRLGGNPYTAP